MAEETKVKCQDCGFLAADADGGRVEVTRNQRMTGERPSSKVRYTPICHEDACPISTEYAPSPEQAPVGERRGVRYLEVIKTERVCPKFVTYRPGRTPEQHRERVEAETDADRDHMREFEILKWQADEASKAHYRQVERDETQRAWQEKQEASRRQYESKWKVYGAIAALAFAIAGYFGGRYFAGIDKQKDGDTRLVTPATK